LAGREMNCRTRSRISRSPSDPSTSALTDSRGASAVGKRTGGRSLARGGGGIDSAWKFPGGAQGDWPRLTDGPLKARARKRAGSAAGWNVQRPCLRGRRDRGLRMAQSMAGFSPGRITSPAPQFRASTSRGASSAPPELLLSRSKFGRGSLAWRGDSQPKASAGRRIPGDGWPSNLTPRSMWLPLSVELEVR
jgi:hypothetical protein